MPRSTSCSHDRRARPRWSSCTATRARATAPRSPPHGREGHQGPRVRSRADVVGLSRFHHSTSTCSTSGGGPGGTRSTGAGRARRARGAAHPRRRPDAGNVEDAIADRAVRGRRRERHRARPRRQGPREGRGLRGGGRATLRQSPRPSACARSAAVSADDHRRGRRATSLRALRGPVRPRDADARRCWSSEAAWLAAPTTPELPQGALRAAPRLFALAPVPALPGRAHDRVSSREVWLEREDLIHTGAHKLNNALGQALLAKRMGKRRIIAETGAGQHSVRRRVPARCWGSNASPTWARGHPPPEAERRAHEAFLGAEVRQVEQGARTLKEAASEAIRDWVTNVGHDPLHARLGGRPGAVSVDRARAAARDRRRVAGGAFRRAGKALRPRHGVRRWRLGTRSGFSGFIDDASVALLGVEAPGGDHDLRFTTDAASRVRYRFRLAGSREPLRESCRHGGRLDLLAIERCEVHFDIEVGGGSHRFSVIRVRVALPSRR